MIKIGGKKRDPKSTAEILGARLDHRGSRPDVSLTSSILNLLFLLSNTSFCELSPGTNKFPRTTYYIFSHLGSAMVRSITCSIPAPPPILTRHNAARGCRIEAINNYVTCLWPSTRWTLGRITVLGRIIELKWSVPLYCVTWPIICRQGSKTNTSNW